MSELEPWPSATDYIDAVQHPALVFTYGEMKEARFDLDMYGIPDGCTGSNAVVFRAMLGPKTVALRCFISQAGLSQQRYLALARHVRDDALGARWMVPATWWDEAVRVKGQQRPVVEMEWVDGRPLDIYVGSLCQSQPGALNLLADRWREMLCQLAVAEVAHGDLQHGNVLVDQTTSAIRLVDLDSAWVPGMEGLAPPAETGHQAFRHPNRPHSDQWGPHMDTFAGLVVLVSLVALAHRPELWGAYNNGDNLIFTADDFVAVDATPLWTDLGEIDDSDFAGLLARLKQCCAPSWQPSGPLEQLLAGTSSARLDEPTGPKADAPPPPTEATRRPTAPPAPPPAEPPATFAPPTPPQPPAHDPPDEQIATEVQSLLDAVFDEVDSGTPSSSTSSPTDAEAEADALATTTVLPPPPTIESPTMHAPVANPVVISNDDGQAAASNPFPQPDIAAEAGRRHQVERADLDGHAVHGMGDRRHDHESPARSSHLPDRQASAGSRSGRRRRRCDRAVASLEAVVGEDRRRHRHRHRHRRRCLDDRFRTEWQRMKVFISYRRRDDPNFAWRLRDQCARHVGEENIFFDIDSVYFGADFVETIRRLIAESDCMLVAIGPSWEPRRLFDEEDYVRMEVLEAAQQGKLLIPVLNGDTSMPSADVLPAPLQFLSRRNAAIVQPERLNRDVETLLTQIRLQLPPDDTGGVAQRPAGESIDEEMRRLRIPAVDATSQLVGHEGHVLTVAFDASGELLASGGSDNTARLWDAASGDERLSVTAKGGRVCSVAIDDARDELLSSSNDVVHVWATRNGGRRTTLAGHTGSVWALALSPDAATVATASADNSACIWDLPNARRLMTLRGHTGWVTAVAYAPSGDYLATGSTDNTCQIWDPTTGRMVRTLRQHTRSVTSISFSHDQRLLATASADGTARIWDLNSEHDVHVLIGHRESVTSVAFTPDDRTVVTSGVDGSCRAWDPASGRLRHVFLGHDRPVHDIAISPDGGSLASAGADGTIRLWPIDG